MEGQRADRVRVIMMLVGILLIGLCVAFSRMGGFGVDPFSCMNLGISGFLHMGFGTWQMILNAAILVAVFFTVRNCIGLGTLANMVCVGYIADGICLMAQDVMGIEADLPLRIVFLCLGIFFASLGCAFYMAAGLGIAAYDSVAFIVMKYAKNKVSFRVTRVISDITVMLVGVAFCLAAHNNLWDIVGLGTVIIAFCNGPLIQFFREKIEKKLLA